MLSVKPEGRVFSNKSATLSQILHVWIKTSLQTNARLVLLIRQTCSSLYANFIPLFAQPTESFPDIRCLRSLEIKKKKGGSLLHVFLSRVGGEAFSSLCKAGLQFRRFLFTGWFLSSSGSPPLETRAAGLSEKDRNES